MHIMQTQTKGEKTPQTGLSILISVHVDSDKIDFKTKTLLKKNHLSLMKNGPNHQEKIAMLNLCVTSKLVCQNLTKLKEEIHLTQEVTSHISQ